MDVPIKKKHPLVKYRYYILGGVVFLAFVIYVIISGTGPRRIRYSEENLEIAEVKQSKFLEYVDVEGIVQPKQIFKLYVLEGGTVERIVAEEGSMLNSGDTILILNSPELVRIVNDEKDELERQRATFEREKLNMEKQLSSLKRTTLRTMYDLDRQNKQFRLSQEEYQLGIKSKAQFEVAEDDFKFNQKMTEMQLEELYNDSITNNIQIGLMKSDFLSKEKRFDRSLERLNNLIVKATFPGQISFTNFILGERISSGQCIGEMKVVDQFKVYTKISEYYIDRVTV